MEVGRGDQGSGRKSKAESRTTNDLVKMTERYLLENFDQFNENDKLKIALSIQSKAIKQIVRHEGFTFATMVQLTTKNQPDIDIKNIAEAPKDPPFLLD